MLKAIEKYEEKNHPINLDEKLGIKIFYSKF